MGRRGDNAGRHARGARLRFTYRIDAILRTTARARGPAPPSCHEPAGHAYRRRRERENAAGSKLAASLSAEFPHGIFWIPLAPITDPDRVAAEIAQSVGIQGPGDRPHLDAVAAILRDREALLVLDNFEQLLGAASLVADLLLPTTELRVLATSRARLRISGEHEFDVPPLPVPPAEETVERAAANAAVVLFVDRAISVDPGFDVNADVLADVAQIVRKLDGLPLAIELAASRVKVLPTAAMLPLLEHSLPLLVGGPRDAPDRLRTLRATLEWSYELLDA